MFVWVDKSTRRSVGFGTCESTHRNVVNHRIGIEVYETLTADPNKLRWGRLIDTESGPDFRIVPPPAVKRFKCVRTSVVFTETRSEPTANLNLWLDSKDYLHVECREDLPSLYLTVCPGSIFWPTWCHVVVLGMQPAYGLRRTLLKNPSSQVFLSNVWFEWTSRLTVQINKGQQ